MNFVMKLFSKFLYMEEVSTFSLFPEMEEARKPHSQNGKISFGIGSTHGSMGEGHFKFEMAKTQVLEV